MLAPQVIANAFLSAATYFMVGVGFALVMRTGGFVNFAHGMVPTCAAYALFVQTRWLQWTPTLAVPAAVLFSSALGWLMYRSVYQPLQTRRAPPLVLLLASLGLHAVLQNGVSVIFSADAKTVSQGTVEEGLNLFGARLTPVQILTVCSAAAVALGLEVLTRQTRMGKAMRALAVSQDLAAVSGIEVERVLGWTFLIASGVAGGAGVLMAYDIGITPIMGTRPLLMGFVAAVIGGSASARMIALGALLVALAQQIGAVTIGGEWQDAIAFAALLAVLCLGRGDAFGRSLSPRNT